MKKHHTDDEPNATELLAYMLEGKGSSKHTAVSKLISARIPLVQLATIEAFAETIGAKRNKAIVLILEAGIEAALGKIDNEEVLQRLEELRGMKIQELLPDSQKEPTYNSEE